MTRCHHLVWSLLLALGLPAFVLAQSAPAAPYAAPVEEHTQEASATREQGRAAASTHFRRGVELFEEEAFRSALVEFERANELAPDYRVLYNIGQTQLRVQDYLGAIWSYERYLSEGKDAIAPDRRAQVEQTLAALRERVGTIHVTVNIAGADVFLDDVKVGTSPLRAPLSANVGRYRVLARAAEGASDARMVDVVGGESASVSLQLVPSALGAPARGPGLSPRRKAAIASWSVGALVLVGSAVTGALAVRADHDLDELLKEAGASHRAVSDKRDTVRTLALGTDLAIGTAAAAALLGTVLWIVGGREAQPRSARATAPSDALLRASLRVDVGLDGLSVRGRY